MEIISSHDFYAFCNRSDLTLLKRTYKKPKLFESKSDEMIKIFYPRRKFISSNQYKPYALRFRNNAEQLRTLGFITPTIKTLQYCPDLNTYIISYDKLPGVDFRVFSQNNKGIIHTLAAFIAKLHQKGIFFRSIHLENLLRLNNGDIALLDIVDIQFKKRAISSYLRFRNLKHLFQIKEDKQFWTHVNTAEFLKNYFKFAELSYFKRKIISFFLRISCPHIHGIR